MDSTHRTQHRTWKFFLLFLGVFTLIDLLSWKLLFSFRLWVLMDRGSFLNLDYLLRQHLRLGVDAYYAYGLLPVSLQHWLFAVFGMGYWPLIGCAAATLVLMAWFWALMLRSLPGERVWLFALLATCCLIHWVTPNFPYSIVQLSILFSLLLVGMGRLDLALAVATVGIWSVPSLPIVLAVLLVASIFVQWYFEPNRRLSQLLRTLAPGFVSYVLVGILLTLEFGWRSVIATATPLAGMQFYKTMSYGWLGSSLVQFLHPAYHTTGFYLLYSVFSPVSWWVFSVLSLMGFGILALRRIAAGKLAGGSDLVILLCAIIYAAFIAFAFGAANQHVIFDPILVMGTVLGISALAARKVRNAFLVVFICLAIPGQAAFVRSAALDWKTVSSPYIPPHLYVKADWIDEWKQILDLSTHRNLLLLSYGTGIHNFFPTVHSPDSWFLNPSQLNVADKERLMGKLRAADVVALDLWSPTGFVDRDPDVQQYLRTLCLRQSTKYYQVWWKRTPELDDHACISSWQRVSQD